MWEFWDKWFPAFFLGSFERFSSINLKLILLILIFLGLVTQVFFLAFSLVLMAFVQVWFHQGGCNFFFGPDLDLGIIISQIFISWFVKLIDSVEISSCRDKIFIFFSHNVLNSPQSALFSFHLDLLDVPVALYLTPNDIRIGRCSLPHDWFIGFQVVWGLNSVVARVRSGAVAKSAIVGVPSFRMVRL